ncbi:MAG: glycoside hydrolase family 38 C-terminal domain-containing protein [Armatimonadota bacterium]|nr:glycoside hydrolase family 38 C-terminal domain-containing protein [Armatimonadota bacterium]
MPSREIESSQDKPYVMHVISHTHWDREWYQEFQGYRQRLVYQVDALLDLLEARPEYRCFHLDGQTSCVQDYLDIRPENRDRLLNHIRSGRVLVGPWFVMPDELLLSGESLVRNLLLGHQLCREWNVNPMKVGYVTDVFGHCSQLPQILRGFDIDNALLHRGTSNEDEKSEMVWEGADGSVVLLVKVYPYTGYQDFLQYREAPEEVLLEYERRKHELATTNVLFALDGNDHQPAYWNTPELIDRVNRIFHKTRCIHSSLPAFLSDLKAALGPNWQEGRKKFRGELRRPNKQGAYAEVFHGTASSRVYLKQANDALEYLLPRCAEPLHAWSQLLGGDSQKAFLNLAWRYLLLCHPHDSIVGCSIDQVHRDVMYRFDQARCIASNSIWESTFCITDAMNTASLPGEGRTVTVHNQAFVEKGPVVRFWFYVPEPIVDEKEREGLVPVLLDEAGNVVCSEIKETSREPFPIPFVRKTKEPTPTFGWIPDALTTHVRYSVTALTTIPPMGYRSYGIAFVNKNAAKAALLDGTEPVRCNKNAQAIENEFVILQARENGTVDLYDKRTGIWYTGLHDIEDCGDAGNGWDHIYPEQDVRIISSTQVRTRARVRISQTSPLSATMQITYRLRLPAGLSTDRRSRSKRLKTVEVRSMFRLDAGSKRVECKTVINNTAKNHRMRVMFPTDRQADTWFCDTAFDCVTRSIRLIDTTNWQERDREESPIKNFAAIQDKFGGLAVITKGLCEACVRDDDRHTLALTLFRGFEQRIGGTRTVDSQMLGNLECEYALCPLVPDQNVWELFRETDEYKVPVFALTEPSHTGQLAPRGSFMHIEGKVVLSTVKTSEDATGIVVRLFNPLDAEQTAVLNFAFPISEAWKCDLSELPEEQLSVSSGRRIELTVKSKQVLTVKAVPKVGDNFTLQSE